MGKMIYGDLTDRIIFLLIEIHKGLGPGLLESAYEECLCYELSRSNLKFRRQVEIPIRYKTVSLDCAFRADVIVEEKVLIELKSVASLAPIHEAQLITYLKLTGIKVGLLVNFNVLLIKDGIVRRVC